MSFELTQAVIDLEGLTGPQKLVLITLARHLNSQKPEAGTWVGADAIARKTGLSLRCVRGTIRDLQEMRFLVVDKRPPRRGQWQGNLYRLTLDAALAERDAPAIDLDDDGSNDASDRVHEVHAVEPREAPERPGPSARDAHGPSARGAPDRVQEVHTKRELEQAEPKKEGLLRDGVIKQERAREAEPPAAMPEAEAFARAYPAPHPVTDLGQIERALREALAADPRFTKADLIKAAQAYRDAEPDLRWIEPATDWLAAGRHRPWLARRSA